MRILVTRPHHLSQGLYAIIRELGAIPEQLPLFEFKPTPNQEALEAVVSRLNHMDMLIFVSRAAVDFGMKAILEHWPGQSLQNLNHEWAAIGPGTTESLRNHGLNNVICPLHPPL